MKRSISQCINWSLIKSRRISDFRLIPKNKCLEILCAFVDHPWLTHGLLSWSNVLSEDKCENKTARTRTHNMQMILASYLGKKKHPFNYSIRNPFFLWERTRERKSLRRVILSVYLRTRVLFQSRKKLDIDLIDTESFNSHQHGRVSVRSKDIGYELHSYWSQCPVDLCTR